MPDIHERLARDHVHLEKLYEEFQARASAGGGDGDADPLADFESRLMAHMEGEEKYLFPSLLQEFPEEVVALREEHETIRRMVANLAQSPTDQRRVAVLATMLSKHARREDGMLYQLANAAESSETHRQLMVFLEETYIRLRGAD